MLIAKGIWLLNFDLKKGKLNSYFLNLEMQMTLIKIMNKIKPATKLPIIIRELFLLIESK